MKYSGKIVFSNYCFKFCSKNLRGNDLICVLIYGRLDLILFLGFFFVFLSGFWEWGWFRLFCLCDVMVVFGYVMCGYGYIVDSFY